MSKTCFVITDSNTVGKNKSIKICSTVKDVKTENTKNDSSNTPEKTTLDNQNKGKF